MRAIKTLVAGSLILMGSACGDTGAACENAWEACGKQQYNSGATGSRSYSGYIDWCNDYLDRHDDQIDCYAEASNCTELLACSD